MMDWYEENIEEGIRDIVRLLRNNGINTEASCEHKNYIQCQYPMDENIARVDCLLFNNGFRNYRIDISIIRENGHICKGMNIIFGPKTPTLTGGFAY